MQLPLSQLPARLQQQLQQLYVLHGEEPLLMQEAADAIRTAARSRGFTERSSHTVSGAHFDWGGVLAASNSLSLFAQQQIVEVHIPTGKPGKEGPAVLEKLAQGASANADVLFIITLPRPDKTMRNSAWFAALQQHGIVIAIENVERAALPQWIAARLHQQNQHVAAGVEGQQALRFFADRVEGNLLAAHQEIQKLALLYPPGELSSAQIEATVLNVARYDVRQLSEAALSGQLQRVQQVLDGLQAEGESEVMVLYMLAEDLLALKRIRSGLDTGKPLPMALREQRVWGVREKLFERALPRLSGRILSQLVHDAHLVDGIVKGITAKNWPTDSWAALHRLALRVCRCCMPPQPRPH